MRLLTLILLIPLLFSFTFRPTTQTIKLTKDQTSTQFYVENTTSDMIPITIKAFERIQNEDGTEKLPKTEDIKVFPPQLIVSPGERKSVRVDWKGPREVKVEKVYRIVAEQVPLKVKKKKKNGGIKMLLKYMNIVYVPPKNPKSKIVGLKYQIEGQKIKVFIRNDGNTHQYLKDVEVTFKKKNKALSISRNSLDKLNGQNILAKTTRVFEFENKIKLSSGYRLNVKIK